MQFVNQQYAVVSQIPGVSRNGGQMVTVNMRGVTDNRHYHTYVVRTYKNSRNWRPITERPGQGHIVTFAPGYLSAINQIDADSVPTVLGTASITDVHATVDELHGVAPRKRKPTPAEVMAQFDRTQAMMRELFE